MKLYLAGPLFNTAEREFNTRLKQLLLGAGFEVWLPQDHEPRDKSAKAIFEKDVEGIDWCDVLVANMDGEDPDSGTCWECGYAYGKKPVIVFRTDFRTSEDPQMGFFNLMLVQSSTDYLFLPHRDSSELGKELVKSLRRLDIKYQ